MEVTDRNAAVDLALSGMEGLPSTVHDFDFYQLVEFIHLWKNSNPEDDDWERSCELVFSANPSLGFAASDVSSLKRLPHNQLLLETNFLGLSGASSPLPGYILEQLINEDIGGLRQPFFDFFNNRLINLAYRLWRKYRYHIRFKPNAEDEFSSQVFALVGLFDVSLRGDTPINWSKMLSYAGVLASRSRSPQVIEGIIAHYFDLSNVSIKEWNGRRVVISKEQRAFLGKQNMTLGDDTVLGSSVDDISGKFTICLQGLSKEFFYQFLPSGCHFATLKKLIEFIIREQLAYDIELEMDESSMLESNKISSMSLGWTSFLGDNYANRSVLIQGRQ